VANNRSTETTATINEAAATWLLRLEAPASPELRKDFQKWLDEEPRHKAAFIRLGLAWYTSEKLGLLRHPTRTWMKIS
jgi:ferric-dicitrate binding protein FerR (iron transport regulator)